MQSMSVQQLLKSSASPGMKGDVASVKGESKETVLDGLLGNKQNIKGLIGKSQSKSSDKGETPSENLGEVDFSALLGEVQNTETNKGLVLKEATGVKATPGKNISEKVVKTSSNLDQLLNNIKGTETNDDNQPTETKDQSLKNLKKDFFPNQKVKPESQNPLDFLVNGAKEKNLSNNEVEVKNPQENVIKINNPKAEFFANKIHQPVAVEKAHTQEQTVKVLSGEDFVKNLKAANMPAKDLNLLEEGTPGNKKQISAIPTNISQMRNYSKGQNILNDGMIRNTNDLAFKENKRLREPGDELKNSETKIGHDLSMLKESPVAMMQLKNSPIQENQVQTQTKVLDLSNIDAKNTQEIIKTITDYVEQNTVGNRSSLDLTVKHDSLGQFKIQVNKMPNQNQLDMQITTSSSEGHKFFVQHESDIMKNLQQVGVNLSDFRIISSMKDATPFSQSESKQFSQFQHEQNGDAKQFMSFESGDFKDGSQRRKSLWQEYQERYGA